MSSLPKIALPFGDGIGGTDAYNASLRDWSVICGSPDATGKITSLGSIRVVAANSAEAERKAIAHFKARGINNVTVINTLDLSGGNI